MQITGKMLKIFQSFLIGFRILSCNSSKHILGYHNKNTVVYFNMRLTYSFQEISNEFKNILEKSIQISYDPEFREKLIIILNF